MLIHKTKVRVRYADTDQMQFVYNGKYFEYFEVGRTEMLRDIGLPYNEIENNGFQLPVIETHAKYMQPGLYDDLLEIESRVEIEPLFRIKIHYTIKRLESDSILATGFTEHVFMKKETKKAVRPPKFFTDKMKKYFNE